jgi:hypothetical protein
MPNKDNIAKWAEALESGEYEQGRYRLASRDEESGIISYCCLGVACDVAMKNGVQMEVTETQVEGQIVLNYDGRRDSLPPAVRNWLGISDRDPAIGPAGERAAILNDKWQHGFPSIAHRIRETYLAGEN